MMGWFCCSSLCTNNSKTRRNGQPINYYRLPRDVNIQGEYRRILKTDNINWDKGHICSDHWSGNIRENSTHLPDLCVSQSQIQTLKAKYTRAKGLCDMVKKSP